jgi:hypothetical protein
MHGASATLGHATTKLGACQLQIFSQDPQQRGIGCGIAHSRFPVERDGGGLARGLGGGKSDRVKRLGARLLQRLPASVRVAGLAQTDSFGSIEVKVQPSSSKWVQQCTLA